MNIDLIKTKTLELKKALIPCFAYYQSIHSNQEETNSGRFTIDRAITDELINILCYLQLKEPLNNTTIDCVVGLLNFIFDDLRFNQESVNEMVNEKIKKEFKDNSQNLKFPLLLKVSREYDFIKGTQYFDSVSTYLYQIVNLIIKSDDTITHYEEEVLTKYNNTIHNQDNTKPTSTTLVSNLKGIFDDFFYTPKYNPSSSKSEYSHSPTENTPEIIKAKTEEETPKESVETLMEKLNKLIGLEAVKKEIESLINILKVEKFRKEKGFPVPDKSLHLVFTGNPGTGKTTIARLLSKIYKSLGVLEKGHLVETDRSNLVAGYVGQTAIKTMEVAKSALGGVLFIDEAYSLSEGAENDFGKEAINSILKFMEDNRNNVVVIVAGYTGNMKEFIEKNPGLKSRFNKYIHFDDYKPDELFDIFKLFVDQSDLKLSENTQERILEIFRENYEHRDERFGNGRFARNFFEKVYTSQANRIVKITDLDDEILCTLTLEDINNAYKKYLS